MVIHDQVDWRSLQDSLSLDVSLVESVFLGLSKQYEKQHDERHQRLNKQSGPSINDNNSYRNNQLDEMLFAKADVLVALENTDGYLKKRPWLRVLHTRLACVSVEKEGANLLGFVRYRQRDRTMCLRDVRSRLEAIYADAILTREVEERHKTFQAQARASSPWCVRDAKCLHPSPARKLYGVHVLPPRPVTEAELRRRRQFVVNHARAVVNAAVSVVMDKLLAPYMRPTASASTGRHSGRARMEVDAPRVTTIRRQAKAKQEQAERDIQLRTLRLELFAPTAELNSSLPTGAVKSQSKKKQRDDCMLLLATVEAQGDARLAVKLLEHGLLQAGFRRAAEQAQRLGTTDQPWSVVKLWRELYRTSTLGTL